MDRITRKITYLAFGRAITAVSPYIEAIKPERADAMILRLGEELAHLPEAIERILRMEER